ncbi:MAG: hypothetical protein JOY77_10970 [Alphaproteobacteria bacterium]|nr:hypothetical protein [Alphaproteobacteria bacterium]MBV9063431.1 hypothetical protein [Alphaproteobacteria bacterium]
MADTRTGADRNAARTRAQNHFAASEQRDTLVRQMIETERASVAARTDKLRALRLAKEEADRQAAANAPKPDAPAKARKRVRKAV